MEMFRRGKRGLKDILNEVLVVSTLEYLLAGCFKKLIYE